MPCSYSLTTCLVRWGSAVPLRRCYQKRTPPARCRRTVSYLRRVFCKHPPMESSRRAKIFALFDALCGFDEAVSAKRVYYEGRRELTEAEREEFDRELYALQKLSCSRRLSGEKSVSVCIKSSSPVVIYSTKNFEKENLQIQHRACKIFFVQI